MNVIDIALGFLAVAGVWLLVKESRFVARTRRDRAARINDLREMRRRHLLQLALHHDPRADYYRLELEALRKDHA